MATSAGKPYLTTTTTAVKKDEGLRDFAKGEHHATSYNKSITF